MQLKDKIEDGKNCEEGKLLQNTSCREEREQKPSENEMRSN